MNLGETIYRLRTEKNMSQGDLADALGVSRQSVSKWENGNATPDLDKLVNMSRLFGVTLDDLVNGQKNEPRSEPTPAAESPQSSPVPAHSIRWIIGILLLISGIVCFLVPSLLGSFLVGYLVGVPLSVIGAMLAFAGCDWLFRICWLLYGLLVPMLSLFGYNFVRFDIASRFGITFLLSLIPLILWTVKKARNGSLTAGSKAIILISILLFFLCVMVFNILFAAPPLESLNIFPKNVTSLL